MTIIKKKKRVSKKNKAAWRKHCDINDVEEFLEDQRLEERLGKFDVKPDEELFVLDTQGNDVSEEKPDIKPDIKHLSAKQRKRALLPATPKCFEVLLPTSKVQDPNAKRNHVKPVGSKPSDLSKLTKQRQLVKGVLAKKLELTKANKKLAAEKRKKSKSFRKTYDKNIWGEDSLEAKGVPETLIDDFISTEAQLHNVPTTKWLRAKPPPPKTVLKRKAVDVPHPGVSYNPSFQEHQELLQEVVQHEQKMMKREAHLHRVTTGLFSKVTLKEKENQWREEMSVGLPQPHDPTNDSEPEEAGDNEYKAINPPVKNKKKDHKARRKQKERIAERERLKREKIDKKKITDIYKLRKIQASLKDKESRDAEERTKRITKRKELEKTALPALNARKPPIKEPEFIDPKQLTGDLRNLPMTSNLLKDRFESFQRRGTLAATKIMMKKKRKLKSYFKSGHKVTDQDIDRYVKRSAGKK
ncbi:ribosome biogenesis protein NOP53 [Nymphalis io]|uniref:ribosome biogenesis protein NOP53 n=1 Tax=Inachis io TaxID=171585 RepID=UPI00216785B6|nr:ribosome biogenesis protein NOP53 [Nymphalis io]